MEEDKQLDFNQPLLSVRRLSLNGVSSKSNEKRKANRFPSKLSPPPIYISDLKSGSMRHPGTVPFLWEKAPGRPKEESHPRPEAFQWPSSAPKLPPGRLWNQKQHGLEKTSSRAIARGSHEETVNESKSFKENETGNCGSDDGDDVFLDAFDTLSRTESLLMNCSATGLSSFDGSEIKPSGPFDLLTRDFMIDRFLPAAKAIASEAPQQHAVKKQPTHNEQPREIKKITQRPLNSHIPIHLPRYETEEDDDYEEPDNSSIQVCGLLPRFCLKGSFCLLNPLPSNRSYASSSITSEEAVSEKRSVDELSQCPLREQKGKPEVRQRNFREFSADKSGSLSPVAEKTLYIDSTSKVRHRKSNSFHQSGQGEADSNPKNAEEEMRESEPKILEPVEAFITLSNRFKSEEEVDIDHEFIKPMKWKDSVRENFPGSLSTTSSKVADFEKLGLKHKQEAGSCIKESIHGVVQDPCRSAAYKVSNEGKLNLQTKLHNSNRNLLLLDPPMPKSPSDSWLKRTLQTAPSKNPALRYSSAAQNRC